MKELKIQKTITINAEVGKVWEALTKPEMTRKYMSGSEVISDWKVGSPILWKATSKGEEKIMVKGSIEKIEVGRLLQFTTFDTNAKYTDAPRNYVQATYELTPKFGKTVLSITQGDFSHVEDGLKRFVDANGDWTKALTELKTLVEKK